MPKKNYHKLSGGKPPAADPYDFSNPVPNDAHTQAIIERFAGPGVNPNRVDAMLRTIYYSEGTLEKTHAKPRYDILVGGGTFSDLSHHPQKVIHVGGDLWSSAAGALQAIRKTWKQLKKYEDIIGFHPSDQAAGALHLIEGRHAMEYVRAGDIEKAFVAIRREWASIQGANYPGQHTNSLDKLTKAYTSIFAALEAKAPGGLWPEPQTAQVPSTPVTTASQPTSTPQYRGALRLEHTQENNGGTVSSQNSAPDEIGNNKPRAGPRVSSAAPDPLRQRSLAIPILGVPS